MLENLRKAIDERIKWEAVKINAGAAITVNQAHKYAQSKKNLEEELKMLEKTLIKS